MTSRPLILLAVLAPFVVQIATPGKPRAADDAASPTATVFDGLDPRDTTEDPSYVDMGEDLAKPLRAELVGKAAPPAVMTTIDGETIDLSQSYGKKPIYLKFWATWCVPCRQQTPGFEKLFESLGDKVQVIAVNMGISDDLKSIRVFRDKFGLKMPIVMDDGHLASLFHAGVTPQHILIGKDAKFAYVGHADSEPLLAALTNAAKQEDLTSPPVLADAKPAAKVFKIGDVVSGLKLKSISGEEIKIGASASGKTRGVFLFASWCEWYLEKTRPSTSQACAKARESIAKLSAEKAPVEWVGVSGGPWALESDLADYVTKNSISFPVGLDESRSIFAAFGVRDLPAIVLLDRDGRLLRVIGSDEPDFGKAIASTLKASN